MNRVVFALVAACALAGCERAKQDMYDQPRYKTYAPSPLFEDGASARPPVAGTETRARGAFVISAARKGNAVISVSILSEAGAPLRLHNPWGEREVVVTRTDGKTERVRGALLAIPTAKNERLTLSPAAETR